MTSKIDAPFLPPLPAPSATGSRSAATAGGKVEPVGGAGAAATVAGATTTAQPTAPVLPQRTREAPVDQARVERLRAAILDGSYVVDSGRIADRLIDWERQWP